MVGIGEIDCRRRRRTWAKRPQRGVAVIFLVIRAKEPAAATERVTKSFGAAARLKADTERNRGR
jgi:thiamine monophosphate synthase